MEILLPTAIWLPTGPLTGLLPFAVVGHALVRFLHSNVGTRYKSSSPGPRTIRPSSRNPRTVCAVSTSRGYYSFPDISPKTVMESSNGHIAKLNGNGVYATYKVQEQPLGTARHIRIVGIGAGASGLNLIRTLRLNLNNYELVVYEKNTDVGGTWLENRYPGCRCDVPSHSYQFSWRPKKDWTNFHSTADEIGEYLCKICDEEGMRDSIKTSHEVLSAKWNEGEGEWELTIRNLETGEEFGDHATFLVNGSGILKYVESMAIQISLMLIPGKQQLEVARRRGPPRLQGYAHPHRSLAQRL